MKKLLLFLLYLSSSLCAEVNFADFDSYQGRCTRGEIESKLGLFLQKDGGVGSYFSLTDTALTFYNDAETNPEREVEYELKLATEGIPAEQPPMRKDLVGVKIAIDPGHLGGPFANLEDRYIDIPPSLERSESIKFDEGTLCFLTAMYLKLLLEKEGAIVMVTRDQIGSGVYHDDFFDWLKKNVHLWTEGSTLKKMFGKYYNPLDLRARAKKINQFGPDLSVVIHYNSQDGENNGPSNHTVSPVNYNMVFVPGAFCQNELADQDSRYEFMRLLVSHDLHHSLILSQAILEKFSEHLLVPPVTKADGANYLNRVGIKIGEGIYARNLALTRLIHGPVCYGETLIQNNIDECVKLNRRDFVINGVWCSSRIKQVAEAYFEGIRDYFLTCGKDKKIGSVELSK
ncbi:MAG: N-acetylmuramoyl-L-alanine amidase [Verrucomicrobia bacterium]|nr:N-acetylmuramoyl-L-alanine amidase [Verrucomicrobiota bacterium]